jgi:hypothetical protein
VGFDIYIQTPDGKCADGDENYFRFAWTQMPRTLDAMSNFGMLTELPLPVFPDLSAFGLEWKDLRPGVEHDPGTLNRIAEFRSAFLAARDASEREPNGIPRYKLDRNDGYLVTPAEITAALAAYEAHPQVAIAELPIGDPTWSRWIAFLRRAKTLGGLRTY